MLTDCDVCMMVCDDDDDARRLCDSVEDVYHTLTRGDGSPTAVYDHVSTIIDRINKQFLALCHQHKLAENIQIWIGPSTHKGNSKQNLSYFTK